MSIITIEIDLAKNVFAVYGEKTNRGRTPLSSSKRQRIPVRAGGDFCQLPKSSLPLRWLIKCYQHCPADALTYPQWLASCRFGASQTLILGRHLG